MALSVATFGEVPTVQQRFANDPARTGSPAAPLAETGAADAWPGAMARAWPTALVARRCENRDAEALWRLFRQPDCQRHAMVDPASCETPEAVRAWLGADTGSFRMVGVIDGFVVGFAGLYPLPARQNHVGWITLCIDKGHRGKGIGAALLRLLLATADRLAGLRRVQLHVLADNAAALSLYRKFGFRVEGRHRALVQSADGDLDAFTMARLI